MDQVVVLVGSLAAHGTDAGPVLEALKERHDVLLSAAQTDPSAPGTTPLLAAAAHVHVPAARAAVALMLAVQAERVPDSAARSFLSEACRLMRGITGEQAQRVARELTVVAHAATFLACDCGRAATVIRPLVDASLAVAPQPLCLTAVHGDVLQACLKARNYEAGGRFLTDNPIIEISPRRAPLEPADYLRYFYYAGTVRIGEKKYADALDMFMKAVTAPATALSAIAIKSLKRALLLSLITSGRRLQMPRYASSIMQRLLKHGIAVYDDVTRCFEENDSVKLEAALVGGHETLQQDGNWGIAQAVKDALVKHKIRQLTTTYITLSLGGIGSAAGGLSATATEKALLEMVRAGQLDASVDQSTGTVRFQDRRGPAESARVAGELQRALQRTVQLADSVRELERRVVTSPVYVARATASTRGGGAGRGGGGGYGEDADFMGDYAGDRFG